MLQRTAQRISLNWFSPQKQRKIVTQSYLFKQTQNPKNARCPAIASQTKRIQGQLWKLIPLEYCPKRWFARYMGKINTTPSAPNDPCPPRFASLEAALAKQEAYRNWDRKSNFLMFKGSIPPFIQKGEATITNPDYISAPYEFQIVLNEP